MQHRTNYHIRRASIDELKTVQTFMLALYQSDRDYDHLFEDLHPEQNSHEEYTERIRGRDGICLVAELDGEVIACLAGLILVAPEERPAKRTRLEKLFVKEEFRGKGIGAALVEAFVKWSRENGVERVFVRTYATNESAIHLYERFGFRPYVLSLVLPIE